VRFDQLPEESVARLKAHLQRERAWAVAMVERMRRLGLSDIEGEHETWHKFHELRSVIDTIPGRLQNVMGLPNGSPQLPPIFAVKRPTTLTIKPDDGPRVA
jgi:hypothetical protein